MILLPNQDELNKLNKYYFSPSSSLHFVFGAKRSGKTTFLLDFLVKKRFFSFTFYPANETVLFISMVKQLNKKFKLNNPPSLYNNFEKFLLLLKEIEFDEKIVIVFDNFDELIKLNQKYLEKFLNFWENNLSKKNIMFIISSSTIFEKVKNRFYNIFIKSYPIQTLFNMRLNNLQEMFFIFAFLGSSPKILNFYNKKLTFEQNLYNLVLKPTSPFFNYGIDYLKLILNDIHIYSSILYAISRKNHKIGEIAKFIGVKSTYLTRYLQKLQDLMVIEKKLPKIINNNKLSRFEIKDNFLRFWFCYIYPNINLLQYKKYKFTIQEINLTSNNFILNKVYTKVIKDIILTNPKQFIKINPIELNSWWDSKGNFIDLVGYDLKDIVFIKIVWDKKEKAPYYINELKQASINYKTSLKKNYIIITRDIFFKLFEKGVS